VVESGAKAELVAKRTFTGVPLALEKSRADWTAAGFDADVG